MAYTFHYVDPAAGGGGDGTTWAQAYTFAEFQTHYNAGPAAGDVFFIKAKSDDSAIAITADITSTNDGSVTDPVIICGVKYATTNVGDAVDHTDFPDGDKRPYLDDGGSGYGMGGISTNYLIQMNIRMDTSDGTSLTLGCGTGGWLRNCKLHQEYTGATNRVGFNTATNSTVIDCEVTGAECLAGISLAGSCNAVFCWVHDLTEAGTIGIQTAGGTSGGILFNIIESCTIGLDKSGDQGGAVFGNTFYDCDQAIKNTTDVGTCFINNIFSECDTEAIYFSTAQKVCVFMYNNFYNNLADYNGFVKETDANDLTCDFWSTTVDPAFTSVVGNNFSLAAGSGCIDAGMAMRLAVGA